MNDLIKDSLTVELCIAQGSMPEWVTIFPAPDAAGWVQGRDGRKFFMPDPQAVLGRTLTRAVDLRLDYEHASEIKAPRGDEAPAAGWFSNLRVAPDGSVEGKLTVTDRALNHIEAREYRYLSPVPVVNKETREVHHFSSVGLTNSPNLYLPALNHEESGSLDKSNNNQTIMTPEEIKELCRELGIAEDSKAESVIAAAKAAKQKAELNREQTPSLEKYVPRADYDSLMERARNAEQKVADTEKTQLEAEINREVDAAVKAGKITPATKEFYAENCRQQGGLDRFKKFVADAPVIGAESGLDEKKPVEKGAELNSEEKAVCEQMGVDSEAFRKTRDAELAQAS